MGVIIEFFWGLFLVCFVNGVIYLSVYKDINNGVVDSGIFGEVGW